jgi:hypothetical protein
MKSDASLSYGDVVIGPKVLGNRKIFQHEEVTVLAEMRITQQNKWKARTPSPKP